MTTCFVAGIVKGLVEHEDPYRHFGSLLGFRFHAQDAINAGLIDGGLKLTALGIDWYKSKKLDELEDCRAYFWGKRDFGM